MKVFSKDFFSYYIFHPLAKELCPADRRKAVMTTLGLGLLTAGILHVVCLIKFRGRKFDPIKAEVNSTLQKTDDLMKRSSNLIEKEPQNPSSLQIEKDAILKINELNLRYGALSEFFNDPSHIFAIIEKSQNENLKALEDALDTESNNTGRITLKRLASGENDEQKFLRSGYAILFPSASTALNLSRPAIAKKNWETMQWSYCNDEGKTVDFDPKVITKPKNCILLQKQMLVIPQEYQSENEMNGSYHAVVEKNPNHPPFYHEMRMGRGYCTKHAINATMGHHFIGAKQIWNDLDEGQTYWELLSKLKENKVYSFPVVVANEEHLKDLKQRDRFILYGEDPARNTHALALRKDPQTGEWWRIDSLSVYEGKLKQEVVNIEIEILNYRVICLSDKEEVKKVCRNLLQQMVDLFHAGKPCLEHYSDLQRTFIDTFKVIATEKALKDYIEISKASFMNYSEIEDFMKDSPGIAQARQAHFHQFIQPEIEAIHQLLEIKRLKALFLRSEDKTLPRNFP